MAVNATDHYDQKETRNPAAREAELFSRLPGVVRKAMEAPGYGEHLRGVDPAGITAQPSARAAVSKMNPPGVR